MHLKCIRNVSEIYPKLKLLSLDLSHSNTIKIKTSIHISSYITYIYPKFNLLSLYLTYSNTVKIPNASEMHQKSIRNLSQIQPSLPRSQSLKYYKNQNKHTYFFLYYLYLCQYPGTNVSRCLFRDNISRNISNHCILLRQLVPRHIHISFYIYLYLSQIYPKFNLLSLYLTYSNTVKFPNVSGKG